MTLKVIIIVGELEHGCWIDVESFDLYKEVIVIILEYMIKELRKFHLRLHSVRMYFNYKNIEWGE